MVSNDAAGEELVEWVEPDGTVIEVVTRARMRAEHLRHRCVYIVVLSLDSSAVLIHRRADWKDVFPGAWDVAFGGVCDAGESWEAAAHRELMEEAGVAGEFTDHGDVCHEAADVAVVGRLYSVHHEGPFGFNDGEVTAVEWVDRAGLRSRLVGETVPGDSDELIVPLLCNDEWPQQRSASLGDPYPSGG